MTFIPAGSPAVAPVAPKPTVVTSVAAQPKPVTVAPTNETDEQRMKRLDISDLPYHTAKTAAALKAQPAPVAKPYVFKANGYTVTSKDAPEVAGVPVVVPQKPQIYTATAPGFEKSFASQREAEIYVETHAPFIKTA